MWTGRTKPSFASALASKPASAPTVAATTTSTSTTNAPSSTSTSTSTSTSATTTSAPTKTPISFARIAAATSGSSASTSTSTSASSSTSTSTSTSTSSSSSSSQHSPSFSSTTAPTNGDSHQPSLATQLVAGAHVSVTSASLTQSGIVYCYDPISNILVLEMMVNGGQSTSPTKDFIMIPTQGIKVTVISPAGSFPVAKRVWEPVDPEALNLKEQKALQERQIESEKIGIGVTPLAQHLFDVLSKTIPCRWDSSHQGVIVVMDTIRISSPYTAETVHGTDQAQTQRVRKIVEVERARMQKKQQHNNTDASQ